jgi:proline-specific peptidase
MKKTFTTPDGLTLAYEREGSGPLLVCHGGGPGFSSLVLDGLAGLAQDCTLIKLDPRGTGGSERPADARAYRIAEYVADVGALRAHLGEAEIDLLGHSHGGVVAMGYAAEHPTQVRRLVLANTLARFGPEQEQAMERGMEAKRDEPWYEDARAALEAELAGAFADEEELLGLALREFPFYFARYGERERAWIDELRADRLNSDTLRLFNEEILQTFDLRPNLALIDAPTLVLTGEQDFITGPVCAEEIADGIVGAELVLIPDCGHLPFVEQPERFREEVLRFMD